MNITIEEYIATNNPREADAIIRKYGIPASKNYRDLVAKLRMLTKKKREIAFKDLVKIDTPYKMLILSSEDESSNACGCSGFDGEKKSNCSGCGGKCGMMSSMDAIESKTEPAVEKSETKTTVEKSNDNNKNLTYIGLGILGMILVAVMVKK